MNLVPNFDTIAGMSDESYNGYKEKYFERHKERIIKVLGNELFDQLASNTFHESIVSLMKYESPSKSKMPANIRFSHDEFEVPSDFMIPVNALMKGNLQKVGIFRLIGDRNESSRVKKHMCRMIADKYSAELIQEYVSLSLDSVDIGYMIGSSLENYEGCLIPGKHLLVLMKLRNEDLPDEDFLFAIKTMLMDLSKDQRAMIEAISAVFVQVASINIRRIRSQNSGMGIKQLNEAIFIRIAPIDSAINTASVPNQHALIDIFEKIFVNYELMLKVDHDL